mgnify:CR=1 FL=1
MQKLEDSETIELGLQITEQEYRKLPYPSYSLLSGISKYGPDAIYGKSEDISDLDSIIIGSLVDSIVTDGGVPDNMVIVNKKPSGKAIAIIKALCNREDLEEEYLLSVKNEALIKEECDELEYYASATTAQRIKHLKKYDTYVKALSKHGEDAMIVSSYQYHEASVLSKQLFTKYPFLSSPDILGQVKVVGEIKGVKIKGMLDFIFFNHKDKKIIPFDLKTGMGSHHNFFEKGFLNWNYFIQSSVYKVILKQWLAETEYKDYTVENFRFMFCGRTDKLPIIYKVTNQWHKAGLQGFMYNDTQYKGVYELLEEYTYYNENTGALYRKGYDVSEINFEETNLKVLNYESDSKESI